MTDTVSKSVHAERVSLVQAGPCKVRGWSNAKRSACAGWLELLDASTRARACVPRVE
jgi:hypothetical protein